MLRRGQQKARGRDARIQESMIDDVRSVGREANVVMVESIIIIITTVRSLHFCVLIVKVDS